MRSGNISRRTMIGRSAASVAMLSLGSSQLAQARVAGFAAAPLTVQDVLDRMKLHVGGPWREGGVDHFVSGSPGVAVTGIATAMMATFDALNDAVTAGANLVITHEPTYWSHPDSVADLQDDPLYRTKLDYITAHGLVCFHLHDHWHALRPVDGINYGMAQQMGWTGFMDASNQRIYHLPQTTLLALAQDLRTRLGAQTLRVVGHPAMPVTRVYESWGNCGAFPGISFLDSDVDALVIGEAQDWDLIAYAQDLVALGEKKALIVLGHVRSEMFGMRFCAEWLKSFVPEVPVTFIPTVEPYWNVDRPMLEIGPETARRARD